MKKLEKKVDFQAHITDLQAELIRDGAKNYARIDLKNISGRTIEAVTLKARGLDYFGGVIKIEGKEDFPIYLERLKLDTGASVTGYLVEIADKIRKLEICENAVTFLDGTKENFAEPEEIVYYADCFQEDSYKDKPELDELKEIDGRFCCYPKEQKEGWICACSFLNRKTDRICANCGHGKKEIFTECSEEAIAHNMKEKQHAFEKRMKHRALERKKKERQESFRFFAGCVLAAAIIVLGLSLYSNYKISKRMTFTTETEMQDYLAGDWKRYQEEDYAPVVISIDVNENILDYVYENSGAACHYPISEYQPQKGFFVANQRVYYILKDGNIKADNSEDVYIRK